MVLVVVEGEWQIVVGGCGLQRVVVVKDQIMVVAEWISTGGRVVFIRVDEGGRSWWQRWWWR